MRLISSTPQDFGDAGEGFQFIVTIDGTETTIVCDILMTDGTTIETSCSDTSNTISISAAQAIALKAIEVIGRRWRRE